MKEVRAAVGIVINSAGEILISQRQPHQSYPGYWEFPGGKIEIGETPQSALSRELKEEVNIVIEEVKWFSDFIYTYPDYRVNLYVYLVSSWQGEVKANEGQPIRWVKQSELDEVCLLEANKKWVEKLQSYFKDPF